MRWNLVDLLPLALAALCLVGAKPVKPLRAFNDGYLSAQTGTHLRGLFAVIVVLHHLSLKAPVGVLFPWLQHVGYLAVSVFFFLSGYGLMKSYRTRDGYQTRFLRRRVPKILVPYLLLTAVYWGFHALNGNVYSPKALILTTLNGKPIVSYSWYIVCILLFYVVFWLLMRLCRRKYIWILFGACVWYALYMAFCMRMNYGSWWYRTAPILIVGMIWAMYEDDLLPVLRKVYPVCAPLCGIVFLALFYVYARFASDISRQIVSSLLVLAMTVSFLLCVCAVTLKCRIGNPVLRLLGQCSLEIYLVQGLFIDGLRSHFIYIRNDFLWALSALLGTVALGFALHWLNTKLFPKKL